MKSLIAFLLCPAALAAPAGFYSLSATDIDCKPAPLSRYEGKAALVVNTASKCGYTPQYKGLQALYDKHKERGLVVLGFPSNDFGGQEPGSNAEVKRFCERNFKVGFPLFAKASVKGEAKQPVYRFLTEQSDPKLRGEVSWNFEKFVIDRSGKVVARFKSDVKPDSPELVAAIETALR